MSWWNCRHLDNIMFVHYNDLLKDLEGNMRKVAAFLEIPIQEGEAFQTAVRRCTFDDMKKNAIKTGIVPLRGAVFEGGAETFINKGTNGRWKGVLSEEQLKKYDEKVKASMTPEAAAWMENGADACDPKKV